MKYELSINATIRQIEPGYGQHGCLEVRETVTLNAESFMEVATILSRFHELAEALKTGRTP